VTSFINDRGKKPQGSPVVLTTDVSGVLPTANGGTSVNIASAALPLGSGQITFPATQNPSADANTLDDYEEGTWTPTDTSGGGLTFGTAAGTYTKIGDTVNYRAIIVYPVTVDASVNGQGGLPFACANNNQSRGASAAYCNGAVAVGVWIPNANASTGSFYTAAGAQHTNAQLSGATTLFGSHYKV
jgi:hypothetical protein